MRESIGIFDSGVGGLSIACEVHRRLPGESLLYLADTAYCPYGDRPEEEVRARSLAAGEWLHAAGAKLLVVACNTASGAALELLRERLPIPVIGLEPAVKPAARMTRTGRIGVMATTGTARSQRLRRLVERYAGDARVVVQPCPGLADRVESGVLEGPKLAAELAQHTAPLRAEGVDVVVLGCTHYPFVRDAIARALGPGVALLDSGEAIARRVEQVLRDLPPTPAVGRPEILLRTTGDTDAVAPVARRLWPLIQDVAHVDL